MTANVPIRDILCEFPYNSKLVKIILITFHFFKVCFLKVTTIFVCFRIKMEYAQENKTLWGFLNLKQKELKDAENKKKHKTIVKILQS